MTSPRKSVSPLRIIRSAQWRLKRLFFCKLFPMWQYLGFHVTENHYYQPIPDTRGLGNELWERKSMLPGLRIGDGSQFSLLDDFVTEYKAEYEKLTMDGRQRTHPYEYYVNNDMFDSCDAEILYCMIRKFKPRRIYEIGSGNTTCLSAQAIRENQLAGHHCELVAIEPFPNEILRKGFPGLTRLIPKFVQDVPLSEFDCLSENDILFIDSSHSVKIGSDVVYEFLELLPRLRPGVIVHVHDIFFPAEYPREWVMEHFTFMNEQYLLQAFLAFNEAFEVLWAGHYMHLKFPDKLEAAFPAYRRNERLPASFWMRKVR